MMHDKFAIFILTHGRPHNVKTYKALRKFGYTGDIYIIIDNEDKTADEYRKLYGEIVIMFDKSAIAETFDEGNNFHDRRSVVYARNASFQIARDLGIEYFMQMDDDYHDFRGFFDTSLVAKRRLIYNLDAILSSMLKYYKEAPIASLAMGQTGDLIGGVNSTNLGKIWLKRKAMNSFLCSPSRPFWFVGVLNDDVNTYVANGNRGMLFFTHFIVVLNQSPTQQQSGGLTELYSDNGTYVKPFYTVMHCPSCVHVETSGKVSPRIHHKINWGYAVPKIIEERYRKV